MLSALNKTVVGFVTGALAVVIFHQVMYFILVYTGVITSPPPPRPQNVAWAINSVPFWPDLLKALGAPVNVPRLVNLSFWGGLWGVLFAFLYDRMGNMPGWLKGFIFGMIGPMLIGSWLFFSWYRGAPILADFLKDYDVLRLRTGFLLNGVAFGLGLGILYPLLSRITGARAAPG